jgi:hypothetical protein
VTVHWRKTKLRFADEDGDMTDVDELPSKPAKYKAVTSLKAGATRKGKP